MASNAVGGLVDTFAFLWLAGFPVTVLAVTGQLVGKAWATIAVVGIVVAVREAVKSRAVIPVEGNEAEPGDLFALAGRRNPGTLYGAPPEHARGAFLACLGYSARTVRKPSSLDLVDVAWSLTMTQSVTLGKPMYGHLKVMAGRMALEDDELMERARRVLRRTAFA